MTKSHKLRNASLIIGALILTVFISTQYQNFVPGNLGGSQSASDFLKDIGTDTNPKFATQKYDDSMTMNILLSNSLNGTSYTDSTQVDTKYYAKTGGGTGVDGIYQFLAESASGTIEIPTRLFTDNKVYAETVVPSGQAIYVDFKGTKTANVDLVKDIFYADLDKQGAKHYVFGLDVSDKLQEPDPQNAPKETFVLRLFGEGSLTITAGDTASITSQATGDQDATFEFQPTFALNSEAEAIAKAKVRVNSTSTALWSKNDSSLTLTDGQAGNTKTYNIGSDFVESTDYSNGIKIYEKTFSSVVDGANMVYVPSSGGKKIEATLNIGTTFTASTNALCFELELTTVNAQGSQTAISDDVEVTGASSNEECSLS